MAWTDFNPPPGYFASLYLSSNWNDQRLAMDIVEDTLDTFREQQPGIYPKLKKMKEGDTFERLWLWEEDYPTKLVGNLSGSGTVITVTGDLFGATVSRAAVLNMGMREGSVLRYDGGGVTALCEVQSVDASDPVLTVSATAGTSMPDDGASQTWTHVNSPYTDYEPASEPTMLDRDFLYSTTEIFEVTFGIEKSRAIQRMEGGIDELEHQMRRCAERMERLKANACVLGWPQISGGEPQSMRNNARPRLCGLLWWPSYLFGSGGKWENSSLYKSMSGKPILIDDINDLTTAMYDNGTEFKMGNWQIWCHHHVRNQLKDFDAFMRDMDYNQTTAGYRVDKLRLNDVPNDIPVMVDPTFPAGTLIVVNMDSPRYANVKGDRLHKEEIPTGTSRSRKWQLTEQLEGVELRKAKTSIGMLYYIGS